MFDRLDNVRAVARAKCVESFDYFVERALGAAYRGGDAKAIWTCVVEGRRVEVQVTDTFRWLFPELTERRASQRAA